MSVMWSSSGRGCVANSNRRTNMSFNHNFVALGHRRNLDFQLFANDSASYLFESYLDADCKVRRVQSSMSSGV